MTVIIRGLPVSGISSLPTGSYNKYSYNEYETQVKVPILIFEHRGPELIPDSRQSACR